MKHALLFAIAVVMVQASPQLYAQGPHGIRTPRLLEANNKFTTFAPLPGYPLGAEARHLEGNGIFLLHVRSDGSVSRAQVIASSMKCVFLFTDCGGFARTLRPKLTK